MHLCSANNAVYAYLCGAFTSALCPCPNRSNRFDQFVKAYHTSKLISTNMGSKGPNLRYRWKPQWLPNPLFISSNLSNFCTNHAGLIWTRKFLCTWTRTERLLVLCVDMTSSWTLCWVTLLKRAVLAPASLAWWYVSFCFQLFAPPLCWHSLFSCPFAHQVIRGNSIVQVSSSHHLHFLVDAFSLRLSSFLCSSSWLATKAAGGCGLVLGAEACWRNVTRDFVL